MSTRRRRKPVLDAERKGEIRGLLRAARRMLYFRSVDIRHGVYPASRHAAGAFDIAAMWCHAEAAELRKAAGKKEGR